MRWLITCSRMLKRDAGKVGIVWDDRDERKKRTTRIRRRSRMLKRDAGKVGIVWDDRDERKKRTTRIRRSNITEEETRAHSTLQ
ncbi:hypothetical protein QE152_g1939 [Popillia japonica]|uniref:Uncharacterized protein n=1 Tax=Popillia japonica TaxID=7064 RepID=A0AAW1N4N3_POPJA